MVDPVHRGLRRAGAGEGYACQTLRRSRQAMRGGRHRHKRHRTAGRTAALAVLSVAGGGVGRRLRPVGAAVVPCGGRSLLVHRAAFLPSAAAGHACGFARRHKGGERSACPEEQAEESKEGGLHGKRRYTIAEGASL